MLTLVYSAIWVVVRPDYLHRLGFSGITLILLSIILVLIHQGRVRAASHFLHASTWLLVTAITATAGGTRAPFFAFYTLVIMLTVIFSGWRTATFYGVLTLITGLIMAHLGTIGVIGEPFATPISAWLTQATVMIFITFDAYIVFSDINRASRQEREQFLERQRAEQRFEALIANSSDFISIINANGEITFQSPSATRIIGHNAQDMIGQNVFQYVHPDDIDYVRSLFIDGILSNQETALADYQFRHADGSWVYLESRGTNRLDDPIIQGVIVNTRDVTERMKIEEQRRLADSRYRALVENLPGSAAILYDHDLRFLLVDGPEVETTGYDKQRMEGQTLYQALPEEFAKLAEPNMKDVLAGKQFTAELPFDDLIHRYSYIPIKDSSDQVEYGMIVAQNITEQKQAEEALRQSEQQSLDFQEKLKALHEVSVELATVEDVEDLCRRAVELARAKLDFDRIGIHLFNAERSEVRGTFGVDSTGNIRDERHIAGYMENHPISQKDRGDERVNLIEDIDLFDAGKLVGHGWYADVWMSDGKNAIGFISHDNLITQAPVNDNTLELLPLFATSIGHLVARKQVEQALRRSEEQFRTFIQQSSEGFALTDERGNITVWNQAQEALVGVKRDNAVAQPIWHILNQLGISPVSEEDQKNLPEFLTTGTSQLFHHQADTTIRLPNGDEKTLQQYLFPVQTQTGWGIGWITHDITGLKHAQSELEQERNLLRTLIDNIPDHIYVKDREGRFILVNRSLADRWQQDILGKTDFDLMPHDLALAFQQDEEQVMTSGISMIDRELMRGEADPNWQLTTKAPLKGDDDTIWGIVGINRIITKQKQIEIELRNNEQRYRLISEAISDFAFAFEVDSEGTTKPIWITEEPFTRLTGHRWSEITAPTDLYHEEDISKVTEDVQQVIQGHPSSGEYRIITKSGETRWIYVERHPVWDDKHERVVQFYGATTDITERKQAETELIKSERDTLRFQEQLKSLHKISVELSTAETLDDFCRMAVELGRSQLGFDRVGIWLFNAELSEVRGTFGTDENGETLDERHFAFPTDIFHVNRFIVSSKKQAMLYDPFTIKSTSHELLGEGWYAQAGIWNNEIVVGYICVDNLISQQPVQAYQMDLLTIYGTTLGNLYTRKQTELALIEREISTRHFQEQLKTLHEISVELDTVTTLDDFYRMAVELGRERFGFDRIGLWLYDQDTQMTEGTFGTDATGQTIDERHLQFPLAEVTEHIEIVSGTKQVILDDPIILATGDNQPLGEGWMAQAAMWNGETVVGFLCVDNLLSQQDVQAYQMELLSIYGTTLGNLYTRKLTEMTLIERESNTREFQEELKILHEISVELGAAETLKEFCYKAVDLGRRRLGFDRFGVLLYDKETELVQGTYGTDPSGKTVEEYHLKFSVDRFQGHREVATGEKQTILYDATTLLSSGKEPIGEGWVALAGLWNGQEVIGLLSIDNLMSGQSVRSYQAELLTIYGTTVGSLYTRKETELVLREREARLRILNNIARDISELTDLDTTLRRVFGQYEVRPGV